MEQLHGLITDVQRFSLHDGPGIRTTVFLKGCPLRCFWCHNPETWERKPEVQFFENRCIGCGSCFSTCPLELHSQDGGQREFRRGQCTACGKCIDACVSFKHLNLTKNNKKSPVFKASRKSICYSTVKDPSYRTVDNLTLTEGIV